MPEAERTISDARHEESDVGEGFVWGAFALLLCSLAAVVILVLWMFPRSLHDRTIPRPLPEYPAPGLQQSPQADMQKFYAQEIQRLNSVGWIDKAHGIVHIPITQAMDKTLREGIPGWPTSPGKQP